MHARQLVAIYTQDNFYMTRKNRDLYAGMPSQYHFHLLEQYA